MTTTKLAAGEGLRDQYEALKSALPANTVLLLRVGDFYEVFGADAERVAKILQITVTRWRNRPTCGIPYHVLDKWTKALGEAGVSVSVADPLRR